MSNRNLVYAGLLLGLCTTARTASMPPAQPVKAIAASGSHSLAVASDGTVWEWGDNRPTPIQVSGLTGITAAASGSAHTVVLKEDGTVWAWGTNSKDQLGDGTTTDRPAPVPASGLTGVVAIAAGGTHSLALKRDGTVWAWGGAEQYGMAIPRQSTQSTPAQVAGLTRVVAVAASADYSLAVRIDGTVWMWDERFWSPPMQVSGLTGVIAVAINSVGYGPVLKADGTVWEWRFDPRLPVWPEFLSLLPEYPPTPRQVSEPTEVTSVAIGLQGARLAVKRDGTVWAWGANNYGQLGDGTATIRMTPLQVGGLTGVIAVVAGGAHSLALKGDGTLWAWGSGSYGELGDGRTIGRSTPAPVTALTGVTAVSAGLVHSLALSRDGTVWAWGYNFSGQLGDGTTTDRSTPVAVRWPWAGRVSEVVGLAAGWYHSLALKADGTVCQWGVAEDLWSFITPQPTPVEVSGLNGVFAVAAGGQHSLALKSDGSVWAWGHNDSGQLGDGATTDRSTPVQVSGLTEVAALAAGGVHSLALRRDGTVWAWGYNGGGQLGDGTTTNRSTPVQVSGLTEVVALAGNAYHSLALRRDGTVWSWGWTEHGQLNEGTATNRTKPLQVGALNRVVAIAAGGVVSWETPFGHSLALREDGTVWVWGDNEYGQLGDGMSAIEKTPVQVIPLGSPDLVIGMSHSGDFTAGSQGVYTLTISNTGATPTDGTITIVDTLPPGLSYVSATGTDWTCSAADETVTCTNPGPVKPGASSPITLTVDVGSAAWPGVTNFAIVKNASDWNISNNTIGDPTVVLPAR